MIWPYLWALLVLGFSIYKLFQAFDWLCRQSNWVIISVAFATPVVLFGSLILSFHH